MRRPVSVHVDEAMENLRDALEKYETQLKKWRKRYDAVKDSPKSAKDA